MNTPEKCPRCGAESFDKWTTGHQFECNTLVLSNGLTLDGLICMKAQRDQLAERVKRLETMNQELAEALERIEFCLPAGFDRVPSIESALGRAHAAIVKAKGQP